MNGSSRTTPLSQALVGLVLTWAAIKEALKTMLPGRHRGSETDHDGDEQRPGFVRYSKVIDYLEQHGWQRRQRSEVPGLPGVVIQHFIKQALGPAGHLTVEVQDGWVSDLEFEGICGYVHLVVQ